VLECIEKGGGDEEENERGLRRFLGGETRDGVGGWWKGRKVGDAAEPTKRRKKKERER